LERKADAFDEQGMVSLFASRPRKQPQETARSLPPDMRQFIVDLRVEMPNLSIREIAEICDTRFHRRPSHHSIKTVLASGPPPSIQMRRFPLFNFFPKRFCEGEQIRIRYPQRASHARIAFTVNRSTCRGDPFIEATL
jgi:hypothetical protein